MCAASQTWPRIRCCSNLVHKPQGHSDLSMNPRLFCPGPSRLLRVGARPGLCRSSADSR
jgi:hypothetical protein